MTDLDSTGPTEELRESPTAVLCCRSPCEYDSDEMTEREEREEQRAAARSPGAPDDHKEMKDVSRDIKAAFRMLRAQGANDLIVFDSPVGKWTVRCKTRKSWNKRSHDVVVTRPRGVGGRYRTLSALDDALEEATVRFRPSR